jgi:hypothetical protein
MKVVNIKTGGQGHYIGRGGKGKKGSALANPYVLGRDGDRDQCVAKYRAWLWQRIQTNDQGVLGELNYLRQQRPDLVCFCAPQKCHGDVILKCIQWMDEQQPIGWARKAENGKGYEVSSKGDRRFSALSARLADGRTIEEAYQLDVKGYREHGNDWRLGKGKAPLRDMSPDQSYAEYKALWQQWADENPFLIQDLQTKCSGKLLTDMFAKTDINQARALYEILTGN